MQKKIEFRKNDFFYVFVVPDVGEQGTGRLPLCAENTCERPRVDSIITLRTIHMN